MNMTIKELLNPKSEIVTPKQGWQIYHSQKLVTAMWKSCHHVRVKKQEGNEREGTRIILLPAHAILWDLFAWPILRAWRCRDSVFSRSCVPVRWVGPAWSACGGVSAWRACRRPDCRRWNCVDYWDCPGSWCPTRTRGRSPWAASWSASSSSARLQRERGSDHILRAGKMVEIALANLDKDNDFRSIKHLRIVFRICLLELHDRKFCYP